MCGALNTGMEMEIGIDRRDGRQGSTSSAERYDDDPLALQAALAAQGACRDIMPFGRACADLRKAA
jgi:hypothetical protein